jgi:hypothetical protein
MEAVCRFLKNQEIELKYDPGILLLGIYPKQKLSQDSIETSICQCSFQDYSK